MDIKKIKNDDPLNENLIGLKQYIDYLNSGSEMLSYDEFKDIIFYLNNKIKDNILMSILVEFEKDEVVCKATNFITKRIQDELLHSIDKLNKLP